MKRIVWSLIQGFYGFLGMLGFLTLFEMSSARRSALIVSAAIGVTVAVIHFVATSARFRRRG